MAKVELAPTAASGPQPVRDVNKHIGAGALTARGLPVGPAAVPGLARELRTNSERLTEQLGAISEAFRDTGLTIRTQLLIRDEPDDGSGYPIATVLFYGKEEGVWGLYIQRQAQVSPGVCRNVTAATPIVKASRELRILAAALMPSLFASLLEELRTQVEEVTAAVKTLDGVLGELDNLAAMRAAFDDIPF